MKDWYQESFDNRHELSMKIASLIAEDLEFEPDFFNKWFDGDTMSSFQSHKHFPCPTDASNYLIIYFTEHG